MQDYTKLLSDIYWENFFLKSRFQIIYRDDNHN